MITNADATLHNDSIKDTTDADDTIPNGEIEEKLM